jgi:hypothetical protein
MLTDTLLGYSGMLYDKTNEATPILNSLAGRDAQIQSNEFVLGQDYETEAAEIPEISEQASLTAPNPTFVTRTQNTNVIQIFHEALSMSYAKASNGNQLAGVNLAGAVANPTNEMDFQIAAKMRKIAKSIEKTFIQGTYAKAATSAAANQTRGFISAITTNAVAATGTPALDIWLVNQVMEKIADHGGNLQGLTLVVGGVQLNQINGSAVENGLTIVPATRNENGINVTKIVMPFGEVSLMLDPYVPAGTALLLNLPVCRLVHQPVPNKGNFFVEELAKTGAADKYQIYGQVGLDYANELFHGKITGLATTFTKPVGRKVVTVTGA